MQIPPKLIYTGEILNKIVKIRSIKLYLKDINFDSLVIKKIQKKNILNSSLYSAKIEGNPLEFNQLDLSPRNKQKLEVLNIVSALNYIEKKLLKSQPIDNTLLKKLHQLVMAQLSNQMGKYRKQPSAVFNQAGVAVYVCPPASQINRLMDQLLLYINSSKERFVLIKAFISHLIFEKIHPFLDGNGRIGRLLILLVLKKEQSPPSYIIPFERTLEKRRAEYYHYLNIGLKDPTSYLQFMLDCYYQELKLVKEELELESKKEQLDLSLRQEEILAVIKDHEIVSLDFIKRRFMRVPVRTLRYDLKKLVDRKLVSKIGKTKGVVYKLKLAN